MLSSVWASNSSGFTSKSLGSRFRFHPVQRRGSTHLYIDMAVILLTAIVHDVQILTATTLCRTGCTYTALSGPRLWRSSSNFRSLVPRRINISIRCSNFYFWKHVICPIAIVQFNKCLTYRTEEQGIFKNGLFTRQTETMFMNNYEQIARIYTCPQIKIKATLMVTLNGQCIWFAHKSMKQFTHVPRYRPSFSLNEL